jgi:hypothetical protein
MQTKILYKLATASNYAPDEVCTVCDTLDEAKQAIRSFFAIEARSGLAWDAVWFIYRVDWDGVGECPEVDLPDVIAHLDYELEIQFEEQ